jgi:hypothetical protein
MSARPVNDDADNGGSDRGPRRPRGPRRAPPPKRGGGGLIGCLVVLLLAGGGAVAGYYLWYLPSQQRALARDRQTIVDAAALAGDGKDMEKVQQAIKALKSLSFSSKALNDERDSRLAELRKTLETLVSENAKRLFDEDRDHKFEIVMAEKDDTRRKGALKLFINEFKDAADEATKKQVAQATAEVAAIEKRIRDATDASGREKADRLAFKTAQVKALKIMEGTDEGRFDAALRVYQDVLAERAPAGAWLNEEVKKAMTDIESRRVRVARPPSEKAARLLADADDYFAKGKFRYGQYSLATTKYEAVLAAADAGDAQRETARKGQEQSRAFYLVNFYLDKIFEVKAKAALADAKTLDRMELDTGAVFYGCLMTKEGRRWFEFSGGGFVPPDSAKVETGLDKKAAFQNMLDIDRKDLKAQGLGPLAQMLRIISRCSQFGEPATGHEILAAAARKDPNFAKNMTDYVAERMQQQAGFYRMMKRDKEADEVAGYMETILKGHSSVAAARAKPEAVTREEREQAQRELADLERTSGVTRPVVKIDIVPAGKGMDAARQYYEQGMDYFRNAAPGKPDRMANSARAIALLDKAITTAEELQKTSNDPAIENFITEASQRLYGLRKMEILDLR